MFLLSWFLIYMANIGGLKTAGKVTLAPKNYGAERWIEMVALKKSIPIFTFTPLALGLFVCKKPTNKQNTNIYVVKWAHVIFYKY